MKSFVLIFVLCATYSKACNHSPPTCRGASSASVDNRSGMAPLYNGDSKDGQNYIIVLKDEEDPSETKVNIATMMSSGNNRKGGVPPMRVLNGPPGAVKAVVSELTNEELEKVRQMENVKYVEKDVNVYLTASTSEWNLDRIDQRERTRNYEYSPTGNGDNQIVYVIDSGVNTNHENFDGRAVNWKEVVSTSQEDCTGHGTHVAGLVASRTYGVAKEADIRSVRVFGCSSNTPTSKIIEGVNYVRSRNQKGVVVMSIGTSSPVNSLDEAVEDLVKSGFVVVVAAGNSNEDACNSSPARAEGVITVGASDTSDNRSWFSNFGEGVDLFAPGSSIRSLSSSSNTGTTIKQGTSMAAPHVAGVAAILLERGISASDVRQKIIDLSTKNVINDPKGENRLLYID